jgi:uncharacterized tellurite resistance protein B-like protein
MKDLLTHLMGKFSESQTANTKKSNQPNEFIATCALFLEMASIDGEFTSEEKEKIIAIFKNEYGLTENNIQELIKISQREREGSIDLWKFTNQINQNYSIEEKIRIIELMWKIVYTDEKLEKHEDYLIHKIARLLNLKHSELISAKLKAKETRNA